MTAKVGKVDDRGWYVSIDTVNYLYTDGKVRHCVSQKIDDISGFWPTKNEANDALQKYLTPEPELPDCRLCRYHYICNAVEVRDDCKNGSEFKQSQPIRLYEIEVKEND